MSSSKQQFSTPMRVKVRLFGKSKGVNVYNLFSDPLHTFLLFLFLKKVTFLKRLFTKNSVEHKSMVLNTS